MSTDRSLQINGISKSFGDTIAVQDLGFDVRAGELFGFVGRNGAGKTTTMRIVLGVLNADAGEVRWDGAPLDFAARRRIGYMPEERGLYPKMRLIEQLAYLGAVLVVVTRVRRSTPGAIVAYAVLGIGLLLGLLTR